MTPEHKTLLPEWAQAVRSVNETVKSINPEKRLIPEHVTQATDRLLNEWENTLVKLEKCKNAAQGMLWYYEHPNRIVPPGTIKFWAKALKELEE